MRGILRATKIITIVALITGMASVSYGQNDLQFSDVDAFTECSQNGELLNLSFTITNPSGDFVFGATPPYVKIYSDADGSGDVSPGDQFIVQEVLPGTIPAGGSVQIDEVYILPTSLQICPLLLIIEDEFCQCGPFTHEIAQVPYLNAGKDVALCDGESGQLGCGSGVQGYQYSWAAIGDADINALSATDIADPVVSASNMSSNQVVWQYVINTDKGTGSCVYSDTVDVIICPMNDTMVCEGDLLIFNLGLVDADSIIWEGPNDFSATGALVVFQDVQFSNAGQYNAVSYSNGCVSGKFCSNLGVEDCPEPSVDIEKHTNGEDADEPLGPIILVDLDGEIVTWTYIVTNNGGTDLIDLVVTDDKEGAVCTIPFLAPGESQTCTLTGDAGLGMYANLGTVTATPVDENGNPSGPPVTDTDPSHYTGVFINVQKDADRESICSGDTVNYRLTVRMLGGAPGIQIRDIWVYDNNLPDTLRIDSPFFIGDDFNGNGWIDFVDLDSNGVSDEEFKFEYSLVLTEDNVNVANDHGEVWFEGPAGEIFVGEVGNIDSVLVQVFDAFEITNNATSCNPADTGTVVEVFTSSGGCDSIVTTITTLLPSIEVTITETTCDPAQVGTEVDTFQAANGCDSIVTTITELLETFEVTINETTCDPAEAGTQVDTFQSQSGCDSIVTTITELLETIEVTINETTCDPAEAGTQVDTFQAANGCDSIVTTITELLETFEVTINETTCDPAEAGTQVDTFQAANGCDSIVTTITELLETIEVTINETTCDPAEAGTQVDTFQSQSGCDSIVTTITELLETIEVTINETTCDPAEAGTQVDTFQSQSGCDSIVTTITELLETIEVTINETTCDPAEAGTQVDTFQSQSGCDSIVTTITELLETIEVTINETTCDPAEAGTQVDTFQSQTGCDSIVTTITELLETIEVTINETTCDPAEAGTQVDTFQSQSGCDSIVTTITELLETIEVTINETTCDPAEAGTQVDTFQSQSGCDSIVTTITELLETIEVTINETTCDPAEAGTQVDTFQSQSGCDSIVTTITELLETIEVTINETTCNPAEAGTQVDTFQSQTGCDSIVTTITELLETIEVTINETTCDPAEAGTQVDTFQSQSGCDSIVTTITELLETIEVTINETTCDPAEAGTQVDTFQSQSGCDSIVTTITELLETIEVTINETTCDPAEAGTQVDTFQSQTGCDSIVTTITELLETIEVTINETTCDPAEAGTQVDTFQSQTGCDSIVTTITELLETIEVTISATTCDPAEVGSTVDTFQTASGCDSIVTTEITLLDAYEITINEMICDGNGTPGTTVDTFQASNGCDSIVTTNITVFDFPELPDSAFVECSDLENQTGDYCLPLPFTDFISGYDLLIDGELYFDFPFICDLDTAGGYDFTTVIDNQTYGGNVHILLSWEVDNIELVTSPFTYNTFEELAAFMQTVNPGGNWTAEDGDRIEGGIQSTTAEYGTLEVFSPEIGAASFVNYNLGITSEGTLFEDIPNGCHEFTLIHTESECSGTVIVCVDCNEPPVTDTIIVMIPEDSTDIVCVEDVYDLDSLTDVGVCDDGGLVLGGGADPFCIEITNDADNFEPDTICVYHCDGDVCDTTIIIIIPEPPVPPVTDTIIVTIPEDSMDVVCVEDYYDLDNVVSEGICDDGGLGVEASTDPFCIEITNDADNFEPDTVCYFHCDGNGVCDTIIIIVIPEPPVPITDTITVFIPEDSTDIVCVEDVYDLVGLTDAGVCDDGGLTLGGVADPFCIEITNDADNFEPDTICVYHCDGNVCDTTIIIIIPEPPVPVTDTIIVNIPEDSTDIVCVEDVYDLVGLTDAGVCDDGGLTLGGVADPFCIEITNDVDGNENDTICVYHCDGNVCDTTIIIVISNPPVIQTDTIIVNIPEGETDEVCVDEVYDLDDIDDATVCDFGDLGVNTSDNTLCVDVTNDVDGFEPDTICVVHCDGALCDTTIIIVIATPPVDVDTIVVEIPEDSTSLVCVDDFYDLDGVEGAGICDASGLEVVVNGDSLCVVITNDVDGNENDTICVYHCFEGVCDTTIIIITSTPPPAFPPVAVDDAETTEVNTPVIIPILDNDFDPDGDSIVLTGIVTDPVNGGTVVINPDGTVTYTPPTDFAGVDSFEYVICDVPLDGCDTAWVVITIEEGFPPVAVDDAETTEVNTPVIIPILNNDFDPDGDTIVLTGIITDPVNGGTVVIQPDGTVIYTPPTDFAGVDSFEYVICDAPFDGCDTAWVVVIIEMGNPPIAVDDAEITDVNVPVIIPVLDNDFDPDNDMIVLTGIVTDPVNGGTVVVNPDGTITYTPPTDFSGVDSFEYVICDIPFDGCDTAWVVITIVTGTPPVAIDDADVTEVDEPVTIPILDNDFDPDNDSIVLTDIITDPVNGTVTVNNDGTVDYHPNPGYIGVDSFEYVICDVPFDGCDTAWVVITIVTEDCLFPQAITPNGDEVNDFFEILCLRDQSNVRLKVFNRWGNEVYHSQNYIHDWDGSYDGSPLPDGAYYYVIDYNDINTGEPICRGGYIMIHR